uniref:probable ubiquitin-conjugating enzyme E2 25 n=1 Tax=Erigeron canadensis TaxID=72917 RepID=UPI001CB9BBBB|nr:probable ubiquitin-conjugating enzyme E2 25 [Erigeron canadensis]
MWVPGTTTMLQLLVSIQNQILKAGPLFNEPAYATLKGSSYGEYASFLYNETAWIKSLKTMMYIMNRPLKNFEEFVALHFRVCARKILLLPRKKKLYTSTFRKDFYACIDLLNAAFKKTT